MRRYRIVVALDGSEYAEIVLEHGLDQAARHDHPDIHLATIADDPDDVDDLKRWLSRTALEGLEAFCDHRDRWRTRLHVRVGKPEDEIPDLAAEVDCDLLVIGNYGVHPRRKPIAEAVIARAPCATLVVGLIGHIIEPHAQCPDCMIVRETSEGEDWFCEAHSGDHQLRLSTLVPSGQPLAHGGPLW